MANCRTHWIVYACHGHDATKRYTIRKGNGRPYERKVADTPGCCADIKRARNTNTQRPHGPIHRGAVVEYRRKPACNTSYLELTVINPRRCLKNKNDVQRLSIWVWVGALSPWPGLFLPLLRCLVLPADMY